MYLGPGKLEKFGSRLLNCVRSVNQALEFLTRVHCGVPKYVCVYFLFVCVSDLV